MLGSCYVEFFDGGVDIGGVADLELDPVLWRSGGGGGGFSGAREGGGCGWEEAEGGRFQRNVVWGSGRKCEVVSFQGRVHLGKGCRTERHDTTVSQG